MTTDDDRLARDLAGEAGRLLLGLRAEGGEPAALRKAGDRKSHEFLAARLAELRPQDAVLSEEGRDDLGRLSADRVWIVDPLDGTREFGESGRTDWAVHVALWERGELTAGAVALPAQGAVVLSTAEPPPTPPAPAPGRPVRVLVSRTRPPAFLEQLAGQIDLTLIPLGSAGAKAAEVIRGDADAYVHSGGQYEWDSAAPVGVATAAGCHCSRLDGAPLVYNQPDPYLPDLLVCRADLAATVLDAVRAAPQLG
jgi:3'(2'), 5'-bisphosphate nucleotidase